MKAIFISSFKEMIRSRWLLVYTLFYLIFSSVLIAMSSDIAQIAITLTNLVLYMVPLIAILFGVSYLYQSRDFMVLLFSQPISRWQTVLATYLGLCSALFIALVFGLGLPLLLSGNLLAAGSGIIYLIIFLGCVLSTIFSLMAFTIGLRFDNRVKGLGLAILLYLFFAILYDGLMLILMVLFQDYHLDRFSIVAMLFNPIDLARILITLKLDISAMMGYTGAVLTKFLGTANGTIFAIISLLLWIILPYFSLKRIVRFKDF